MTQVHSKRIDLRHFRRAQAKEDVNGFNDALRNPVRRACFWGKTFRSGLTVPATALPQQADVVVRLPQHVVGQERQNYGADFALQNAFGAGFFEVPEPCGFLQNILARHCLSGHGFSAGFRLDDLVLHTAAGFQHLAGIPGKIIGALDQCPFCRIQHAADEQGVFFHDPTEKQVQFHGVSQRLLNIEY